MRVAIVTPVHPPYAGGMGAVAQAQVAVLRAAGEDVQVFTPDYSRQPRVPDVEYLLPLLKIGNAALVPGLLSRLGDVDLVHLHYPFYGGDMFVWLWSWLTSKPYVLTYHLRPQAKDWRNLVFRLHRVLLEPLMLRRARAVMVSSLDYAKSLGLKHPKLTALLYGVDLRRFTPGQDPEFRLRYKLPLEALVFIFVGGLDKAHDFKGVDILLRAAAQMERARDWRLLIVGEGDLRPSYAALTKDLGLSDQVVFTGRLSDEDLPRAYKAADVHVLPSINQSEAFGLVTLEAAATGLPSVVTDLPGVRTLVVNHRTGFVVPPHNPQALTTILDLFLLDQGLAKAMGPAAYERVRQGYNQSLLTRQLQKIYQDACAKV